MLTNYVGKLLFPRLPSAQYGNEFKIIAASISLGLVGGGILVTVMILRGAVGNQRISGFKLHHHPASVPL
jgi:hypothetical protein